MPSDARDDDKDLSAALRPHQLAAAAAPDQHIRDLIGNFGELQNLFDQLAEPITIELGKPLPKKKHLPGKRVGSCPAAHNRALLGDEQD